MVDGRAAGGPPGVLRGVKYLSAEDAFVILYIAEEEPLFRCFVGDRKWNYDEFLTCRIGGIQFHADGLRLDVGPDVPWQWRMK